LPQLEHTTVDRGRTRNGAGSSNRECVAALVAHEDVVGIQVVVTLPLDLVIESVAARASDSRCRQAPSSFIADDATTSSVSNRARSVVAPGLARARAEVLAHTLRPVPPSGVQARIFDSAAPGRGD